MNHHFLSVYTIEDTSHLPTLNEHSIPAIESITINIVRRCHRFALKYPTIQIFRSRQYPFFSAKRDCLQIAPPLAVVFQASLNQFNLPADWKVAHAVPVFKKDDK